MWPYCHYQVDLNAEVMPSSGMLCSEGNPIIQAVAFGDSGGKGFTSLLLFMCDVYLIWQVMDEWFHQQQRGKWKLHS